MVEFGRFRVPGAHGQARRHPARVSAVMLGVGSAMIIAAFLLLLGELSDRTLLFVVPLVLTGVLLVVHALMDGEGRPPWLDEETRRHPR